jgi:hypothetical protein
VSRAARYPRLLCVVDVASSSPPVAERSRGMRVSCDHSCCSCGVGCTLCVAQGAWRESSGAKPAEQTMSCGLTPSTTTSARTALQRLARAPCTGGREKSTRAPRRVTPAQRRPVAVVRACMLIRSCFTLPGVPYPSQARLHSGFRMGWPFARLQPAHPPSASQTEHYAIHVLVPIPTTALW